MGKKTYCIILAAILTMFCLSGCKKQEQEEYKWDGHDFEDMLTLYEEQTAMFEKIADIFSTNERFWLECRETEYHGTARIMSPYDEEKMAVFSIEEKEFIAGFFEKTHPYDISVRDEYVTIHYINEERTDGFAFVYYYGNNFDYWVTVYKGDHPSLVALDDNWVFYPPKESSQQ